MSSAEHEEIAAKYAGFAAKSATSGGTYPGTMAAIAQAHATLALAASIREQTEAKKTND